MWQCNGKGWSKSRVCIQGDIIGCEIILFRVPHILCCHMWKSCWYQVSYFKCRSKSLVGILVLEMYLVCIKVGKMSKNWCCHTCSLSLHRFPTTRSYRFGDYFSEAANLVYYLTGLHVLLPKVASALKPKETCKKTVSKPIWMSGRDTV